MKSKNTRGNDSIAAAQWFVFLLANSLTLPIVIGQTYHLPADQIAGLMQRTFFVVGLSSMLSGWIGHRLPVPDGPAGIWLGVFVLMGELAATQGAAGGADTLRLLEGGMLVTGATMAVIGLSGWVNRLLRVFTPMVTGVYLMLLAFQLSGVFLKGMLGVGGGSGSVSTAGTTIAFAVFLLVLLLSIAGKGWWKSYAVLIGIGVGWLAIVLVQGSSPLAAGGSVLQLPAVFAWGTPRLDGGMVVSGIMVALVLVSNIIASVTAMRQVLEELPPSDKDALLLDKGYLNRGGIVGGLSNLISSLFSTVGVVPLSITAGFVRMTGQSKKPPYMAACLVLILVSLIPTLYSLFALLPGPVAYAAMLASFAQMVGIGLSSVAKAGLDQRRLTIIGIALSLGTGIMFLPQTVFASLPTLLQSIMSNGLLIGMLIALVLEQLWRDTHE